MKIYKQWWFWILILLLTFILLPQILHPKCIIGGGKWKTLPDTCVDKCNADGCGEAITPGCDCGSNKCWNGRSCTNEK